MKILAINPCGYAVFELEGNKTPYFSPEIFQIVLDGKAVRQENKNVFTLSGLSRGAEHTVTAAGESASFTVPEAELYANVKDFGAVGDGFNDDTAAFTAALSCLAGRDAVLEVPAGVYNIKQIFLTDGVTLYLEKGATLSASCDRSDYPVLPALIVGKGELNAGTWQGEEAECFASPITAIGRSNVCIAGDGVIDCNAEKGDWYVDHRKKRGAWRPRGVFFNRCKGVTMLGVTVKNTASWNIHPYFCRDVKLFSLNLVNPPHMPTTDGIDPDCCDGVEIVGADISVGDDCIALKSGTFGFAKKYQTPCRNVVIRNCLMREGHGGVVFGSELSGGIERVTVEKSLFFGTDRGLRIKTRRGRGRIGKCDGVVFENIKMTNVKTPFVINMYYNMGDGNGHTEYVWTTEKLPVDERTPEIGAFTFRDIECTGAEYCAGAFYGLPESPIKSVAFENVKIAFEPLAEAGYPDMKEKNEKVCRAGLLFDFVESVSLKNVTLSGISGERVLTRGVGKIADE